MVTMLRVVLPLAVLIRGGLAESKSSQGLETTKPNNVVGCLTEDQCRRKFKVMDLSGYFYAGHYPTKGCFSKSNHVYFGTGGTVDEMTENDLPGIRKRVWCERETKEPATKRPSANPTVKPLTGNPTKEAEPPLKPVTDSPLRQPTPKAVSPSPVTKPIPKPQPALNELRTIKPIQLLNFGSLTDGPTTKTTSKPVSVKPVTKRPKAQPTTKPLGDVPTTQQPVTASPTKKPTINPVTNIPTKHPTPEPVTDGPTNQFSVKPTSKPVTGSPTVPPKRKPVTASPTRPPTELPTSVPTIKHMLPNTVDNTAMPLNSIAASTIGEGSAASKDDGTFFVDSTPARTLSPFFAQKPTRSPSQFFTDAPTLSPEIIISRPTFALTVSSPMQTAWPTTKSPELFMEMSSQFKPVTLTAFPSASFLMTSSNPTSLPSPSLTIASSSTEKYGASKSSVPTIKIPTKQPAPNQLLANSPTISPYEDDSINQPATENPANLEAVSDGNPSSPYSQTAWLPTKSPELFIETSPQSQYSSLTIGDETVSPSASSAMASSVPNSPSMSPTIPPNPSPPGEISASTGKYSASNSSVTNIPTKQLTLHQLADSPTIPPNNDESTKQPATEYPISREAVLHVNLAEVPTQGTGDNEDSAAQTSNLSVPSHAENNAKGASVMNVAPAEAPLKRGEDMGAKYDGAFLDSDATVPTSKPNTQNSRTSTSAEAPTTPEQLHTTSSPIAPSLSNAKSPPIVSPTTPSALHSGLSPSVVPSVMEPPFDHSLLPHGSETALPTAYASAASTPELLHTVSSPIAPSFHGTKYPPIASPSTPSSLTSGPSSYVPSATEPPSAHSRLAHGSETASPTAYAPTTLLTTVPPSSLSISTSKVGPVYGTVPPEMKSNSTLSVLSGGRNVSTEHLASEEKENRGTSERGVGEEADGGAVESYLPGDFYREEEPRKWVMLGLIIGWLVLFSVAVAVFATVQVRKSANDRQDDGSSLVPGNRHIICAGSCDEESYSKFEQCRIHCE